MSSTIEVVVPTTPMADSVNRLASHVDGTTAAVVAMKLATIEAEHAAAERICDNVNRGFHALIRSQISQKSAKAKSILDSKLQEIVHFHAALRRVRAQMERDYHRISRRYGKLFRSVDATLKLRIFELDKAPATLAGLAMPLMERRMLTTGVQSSVHQTEILPAAMGISSAITKRNTSGALHSMQGVVAKTRTLQDSLRRITDAVGASSRVEVYLPAISLETDDLKLSMANRRIYVAGGSESVLTGSPVRQIESGLKESFDALGWIGTQDSREERIRQLCLQRLGQSSLAPRVKERVADLLARSSWQATRGGGA